MTALPDSISYSEIGGSKIDYSAVIDPTTDRSSDEVNLLFATSAMASRTVPRAFCRFYINGTTTQVITYDSVWKGNTTTNPIIVNESAGVFKFTLPEDVIDELGEEHSIVIRSAFANCEGYNLMNCKVESAYELYLYVIDLTYMILANPLTTTYFSVFIF